MLVSELSPLDAEFTAAMRVPGRAPASQAPCLQRPLGLRRRDLLPRLPREQGGEAAENVPTRPGGTRTARSPALPAQLLRGAEEGGRAPPLPIRPMGVRAAQSVPASARET